jgi:hypothetical protein
VRPGQWTLDRSKCVGNCRGIQNLSYVDCVSFGFVGATNQDQTHGYVAVVSGSGTGLGVYVPDGPDANNLHDVAICVPPRETVWGNVEGLGSLVVNPQTGEEKWLVVMTTTKYRSGTRHYLSHYLGGPINIWGSYFGPTFEPIPTTGRLGKRETYNLYQWEIMPIGG